jgi:hypothetical protein
VTANPLALAREARGVDSSRLAGPFLRDSRASTQSALGAALPVVLGNVVPIGAMAESASGLMPLPASGSGRRTAHHR